MNLIANNWWNKLDEETQKYIMLMNNRKSFPVTSRMICIMFRNSTQKIIISHGNPILDINADLMGLNRDRNPDRDWPELRRSNINYCKEVELTDELKKILIEDLAFAFGNNSEKFYQKLREFNLINF